MATPILQQGGAPTPEALPPDAQPMPPEEGAPQDEMAPEEGDIGTQELTVSSGQLADEIFKQLPQELHQPLKQLLTAGMQLLFSKDSHDLLMEGINENDEVPLSDELAVGAVSLFKIMMGKAKGQIPGEIIMPAAAILLVRVLEFLQESGSTEVNDQVFSDAMEMFKVKIEKDIGDAEQGGQPVPPEQAQPVPPEQAQPVPPEQAQPVPPEQAQPVPPAGV